MHLYIPPTKNVLKRDTKDIYMFLAFVPITLMLIHLDFDSSNFMQKQTSRSITMNLWIQSFKKHPWKYLQKASNFLSSYTSTQQNKQYNISRIKRNTFNFMYTTRQSKFSSLPISSPFTSLGSIRRLSVISRSPKNISSIIWDHHMTYIEYT